VTRRDTQLKNGTLSRMQARIEDVEGFVANRQEKSVLWYAVYRCNLINRQFSEEASPVRRNRSLKQLHVDFRGEKQLDQEICRRRDTIATYANFITSEVLYSLMFDYRLKIKRYPPPVCSIDLTKC
jgi:hypothetical protein